MVFVIIVCLLFIALGIINCFFGYRYLRKLLMAFGLLVGGLISFLLLNGVVSTVWAIVLSLLIGAAVGVLLYYVFVAGIFLTGASFGATAAYMLCGLFHIGYESTFATIAILVLSIVLGVLAVIYRRFFIVLATSFNGGLYISLFCGYLIYGIGRNAALSSFSRDLSAFQASYNQWILIAAAALGIAGLIIQLTKTASAPKKRQKK